MLLDSRVNNRNLKQIIYSSSTVSVQIELSFTKMSMLLRSITLFSLKICYTGIAFFYKKNLKK